MKIDNFRITLLYVEDDVMIQSAMISFLSEYGFELLIADNASQALHYIFDEAISIDALLTDVNLGEGANGWEVARCARLRTPAMPVIYTSSVSEEEWCANAVPLSKLCMKPFRPSHVIDALTSLMAASLVGPHVESAPAILFGTASPSVQIMTSRETRPIAETETRPQEPAASAGEKPWVVGPLGQKLYKTNLPVANCQWTSRRKAEIVAAFAGGLLSGREVHDLYGLSIEEFAGWQRAVDRFGMPGLKQTHMQQYRAAQQRTQRFGWAG